jgi:hypothetical protein
MDYPDNGPYNPVLRKKGYKIKNIGRKIPVPSDARKKIVEVVGSKINENVTPEIVYEHQDTSELLLLECKVESFPDDLETRGAKQALGYLCLNPRFLSEDFGQVPRKSHFAKILYATNYTETQKLNDTLKVLSTKVVESNGDCLSYDVSGIAVTEKGAFIITSDGEIEVIASIPNGAIIYLIPVDPDLNLKDEYGNRVLEESLRNAIRIKIGSFVGFTELSFSINEICEEIIPVWGLWDSRPKKSIKELVRIYMGRITKDLNKRGLNIEFDKGLYKIPLVDHSIAEKIRSYLRSTRFMEIGGKSFKEIEQLVIEDVIDHDHGEEVV